MAESQRERHDCRLNVVVVVIVALDWLHWLCCRMSVSCDVDKNPVPPVNCTYPEIVPLVLTHRHCDTFSYFVTDAWQVRPRSFCSTNLGHRPDCVLGRVEVCVCSRALYHCHMFLKYVFLPLYPVVGLLHFPFLTNKSLTCP